MSNYTNASFQIVLSQAETATRGARSHWVSAFTQALHLGADKNRNLEPLNRLLASVRASKSFQPWPLIKAISFLSEGNVKIDPASGKFCAVKMKDGGREILFTKEMLKEQSDKHWLDIKAKNSEKETQFLEWKHIMNSLRKFNNKISQGESLLTLEEDELFVAIEKLITEKYGSEVWQTQTKKKA